MLFYLSFFFLEEEESTQSVMHRPAMTPQSRQDHGTASCSKNVQQKAGVQLQTSFRMSSTDMPQHQEPVPGLAADHMAIPSRIAASSPLSFLLVLFLVFLSKLLPTLQEDLP